MSDTEIGRRDILRRGLLLGGAGVALGLAAPAAASGRSGAAAGAKLELEVGLIADTFRLSPAPGTALAKGDVFGSPFLVKGASYRPGTIDGASFDPRAHPGIGTWYCQGFLLSTPDLPYPDVLTQQQFVLGRSVARRLFPADQLVTYGFEPHDGKQSPQRAVTGGAGRYAGAAGVCVQHQIGTNPTVVPDIGLPGSNFRFVFELA
jgi:hypothetical protein